MVGVQVHWLGNGGCVFQERGACAPDAPDSNFLFLECGWEGNMWSSNRKIADVVFALGVPRSDRAILLA